VDDDMAARAISCARLLPRRHGSGLQLGRPDRQRCHSRVQASSHVETSRLRRKHRRR
jgi:hypothetical protein